MFQVCVCAPEFFPHLSLVLFGSVSFLPAAPYRPSPVNFTKIGFLGGQEVLPSRHLGPAASRVSVSDVDSTDVVLLSKPQLKKWYLNISKKYPLTFRKFKEKVWRHSENWWEKIICRSGKVPDNSAQITWFSVEFRSKNWKNTWQTPGLRPKVTPWHLNKMEAQVPSGIWWRVVYAFQWWTSIGIGFFLMVCTM